MRLTLLFFLSLACASLLLPVAARADATLSIAQLLSFDPGAGKQQPLATFSWPKQQHIGALVRFNTAGYDSRKTVELFMAITDRQGATIYKHNRTLNVAAGEHEYVLPDELDLSRMFFSDRIFLDCELKLAGSTRESKRLEIVINGPELPQVTIADLKLVDPKSEKPLSGVQPGQAFRILGTVAVRGNSTNHLPQLNVWGEMSDDTLKSTPFTDDQFSDTNWDCCSLPAANGKWRFAIDAVAPQYFNAASVGSRPFELQFAVAFTPAARVEASLGGTVNSGSGGFAVHKDLELRLIRLERNWDWTVTKLN
jgi:hypothetical protein